MNPQLGHAVPNRLAVSEIARLDPPQANADTSFGGLVTQRVEPFGERFVTALALIPK